MQDIMEAVEVAAILKPSKKIHPDWRDGDAISVAPGQSIPITVGKGGIGGYSEVAPNGGYSQFLNSSYRANGGNGAGNGYPGGSDAGAYTGGNGGSGGAGDDSDTAKAGSDGSNGIGSRNENGSLYPAGSLYGGGKGQRHTTLRFWRTYWETKCRGGGSDRNINGGMVENPITTKDAELEMAIEKVAVTVVAVVVLTVTAVMALS